MFLNLIFPPKCPFCQTILTESGICEQCKTRLPWIDNENNVGYKNYDFPCIGLLRYEGLARSGLLRFKFSGNSAAGKPLGILLAQCIKAYIVESFDTLTWVPISRQRLRKRGYDQAELLAKSVGQVLNLKSQRLLNKIRNSPPQSSLSDPAARRMNASGAYAPARGAIIKGHNILLIDDICTTGSTLQECRKTLYEAGANNVICAVVALSGKSNSVKISDEQKELATDFSL